VNPADNLELAKILEKPPKGAPPEAAFRGSCGRAYYCAFASVREVLLAAKFSVPKDGTGHGIIIELLKRSQDGDIRAAGGLLDQLRVTRNSADYEVGSIKPKGMPFEAYRAQVAIAQAASVLSAVYKSQTADPKMGIP
jgi:hypothetical protein